MALVINTNVASINAQRNMTRTQGALETAMSRLSSGMRITSAKDDAAGLGISEKLRAQIRGLAQAERNANDGISLVQTAEGALNETSNLLIRMRELAVQSASATLADTERAYVATEFNELIAEIDRIAAVTDFNGTQLVDGTNASIDVQVGIHDTADNRITMTLTDATAITLGVDTLSVNVATAAGAQAALASIDTALETVSDGRSVLGAGQNRLASTVNNLAVQRENLAAANSRIRDVDVANESVEMARSQILMQAGVAVLAQSNQLPGMALSLIG